MIRMRDFMGRNKIGIKFVLIDSLLDIIDD